LYIPQVRYTARCPDDFNWRTISVSTQISLSLYLQEQTTSGPFSFNMVSKADKGILWLLLIAVALNCTPTAGRRLLACKDDKDCSETFKCIKGACVAQRATDTFSGPAIDPTNNPFFCTRCRPKGFMCGPFPVDVCKEPLVCRDGVCQERLTAMETLGK
jgi:hypothetical protein